jgi:hypothetical protein
MNTLRRLIRDRSALLDIISSPRWCWPRCSALPRRPSAGQSQLRSAASLLPPGSTYWFGTDRMGGDIYGRLSATPEIASRWWRRRSRSDRRRVGLVAGYYTNRVRPADARVGHLPRRAQIVRRSPSRRRWVRRSRT